MTLNQIEIIVQDRHGYPLNQWISLESVPMITFENKANFYTDIEKIRVKFNTSTELLEVVYGKNTPSGFVSNSGETEDYTAETFFSFSSIDGFISSVYPGAYGTYYRKGK